ncbi:MAG: SAM-dependent methyltransferase, partial [Candidatus Bathyarchaeia archaeon]
MASIIFIIEHLEPEVSKWLLFEYMHASEIVGKEKLWFTNVKRIEDFQKLKTLGRVCLERAFELFPPFKVIVLDPKANLSLKPNDFEGKEAVIIGGILGDHPPKGRTSKLLTATLPGAIVRNIGKVQFSIDGAIYVAKLVSEGTPLEAISVKRGLRIKFDNKGEIYLPYAYPIKNGKPLINPKLIEY